MNAEVIFAQDRGTTPTLHRLALAVLAALCTSSAIGAAAAATASNQPIAVAHAAQLRNGDAVIGALSMKQPIHIEVALKMRDRERLEALITDNARLQATHGTPHLLTSAKFLANHAPTQAQAQAVVAYLASMGFTNITIAPNRLLVSADGTAWTAGNAFKTRFAQVRTHDGRVAFANTDDVRIPAALSDKVLAVLGLQTVHQAHALALQAGTTVATRKETITTHNPTEFSAIYGGTDMPVAADIPIGIVSNSSVGLHGTMNQVIADLNTFTATNGLPPVTVHVINVNGTSKVPTADVVSDLVSQSIVGMAGGQVKQLTFYNVPGTSNADFTASYNRIAAVNIAKVIVVPFAQCETDAQADGAAAADDAIFAVAAAQGQTFAVSNANSGGADQCGTPGNTPSWPAASPYVVAVSSTRLDASTNQWFAETVWTQGGGSPSTFEPMPPWQASFGVPGTTRAVADVAFDADLQSGVTVVVNGAPLAEGGGILPASLFAGLWARVLQAEGTGLGFAAPILYALPAADFNDITSGTNSGGKSGVGFPAGVGYDFPSGRGSMILANVLADVERLGNNVPAVNFSYATAALSASFTDASTDDGGTISSHAWDFGDGSTSTETNPIHAYASAGEYQVKEKVRDLFGGVGSKSRTVIVGPGQYLKNNGFEAGALSPWVSSTPGNLLQDNTAAHDGNWLFVLGGAPGISSVLQRVTIPGGLTSATLSFYLDNSGEPNGADNHDPVKVQVRSTGIVFNALGEYSNTSFPNVYARQDLDMTPYIGQTVTIRFIKINKPGTTYKWNLDDVTLVGH